jgi:hypothetical protein
MWIKAMEAVPATVGAVYVLGCPIMFVEQLNMVLNFGGSSQIVTAIAPYSCPSCGAESNELIDLIAERGTLSAGKVPQKTCRKCGERLELYESPESYFSFVDRYGATSIEPAAAAMMVQQGLYSSTHAAVATGAPAAPQRSRTTTSPPPKGISERERSAAHVQRSKVAFPVAPTIRVREPVNDATLNKRGVSLFGLIAMLTIAILLAIGMYLVVHPS